MSEETKNEKPKYSGYGYHGGGRRKGSGAGTRRVSFCVSCQPEELERIKELAAEAGKTVSRYLIDLALQD